MPPKTTKRWVPVNRNAGAPGRAPAPALGGARDEHHAVGAGQPGWGSVRVTSVKRAHDRLPSLPEQRGAESPRAKLSQKDNASILFTFLLSVLINLVACTI